MYMLAHCCTCAGRIIRSNAVEDPRQEAYSLNGMFIAVSRVRQLDSRGARARAGARRAADPTRVDRGFANGIDLRVINQPEAPECMSLYGARSSRLARQASRRKTPMKP